MKGFILSLSLLGLAGQAYANETVISIKLDDYHAGMQKIHKMDLDVAGVDKSQKVVDVVIHNIDQASRIAEGHFNVIEKSFVSAAAAIDDRYLKYDDVVMQMETLAAVYPEIAELHTIGYTYENRPIWAMKISDNVTEHEIDEPSILFNGMHHARELMSVEVTVDTMVYLLDNYANDPKVKHWIDSNEIWVVPMVNSDGNHKVHHGKRMWRKNTQGGYGVDLNRNYPYMWDSCNGSSGSKNSDTYRGPTPGSEPETQAIMKLVADIQPVFDISYHSYSEMVLYPYGCGNNRTPASEPVEEIGKEMAKRLPRDHGSGTYAPGTPWELLYNADGGDIDWMYNEHHVIPYVIEISSRSEGFQPDYKWRDPTVKKIRAAWMLLLDKLDESSVRGKVSDSQGLALTEGLITVKSVGDNTLGTSQYKIKKDGTYHIVLKPGMYSLSINGKEYDQVIIGDKRVNLNIQL